MNLGFELANSYLHNENKITENSGIAKINNKLNIKSHMNIDCTHLQMG